MRPETVLVSVLYASNEIGSVNPIAEIGTAIKRVNRRRALPHGRGAGARLLPLDVQALNVDLMSLAGTNVTGPRASVCW